MEIGSHGRELIKVGSVLGDLGSGNKKKRHSISANVGESIDVIMQEANKRVKGCNGMLPEHKLNQVEGVGYD